LNNAIGAQKPTFLLKRHPANTNEKYVSRQCGWFF